VGLACWLVAWLLLGSPCTLPAAEAAARAPETGLVSLPEPGWPQWRGPRRDGLCEETGLLQAWPPGGPPLLWKASGLGRGYSAPILTGGRLYITGEVGATLHVWALDLQGQRVWESTNGRAWNGPYPGARASCTYREGRLFHLNAHGRLACLEASTGRECWAVDVLERFGGRNITWGLSENLLVDGPRVVVTPGGTRALMAALDRQTGATVWATEPLRLGPAGDPAHQRVATPAGEADAPSYSSPILFTLGGRRHLVNCSLRHVFGVDADTGRLLWTRPLPTRYAVIAATPVLVRDAVFVTAPDTEAGGQLFRVDLEGTRARVETVWTTELDTCHGGLVYREGALYGSWYRRAKGWACVDAGTGAVRYQLTDLAMGPVLYADQRLYCLSQEGEMALLQPTASGFVQTGGFRLAPERTSDAWTHPVILDGRLYLRFQESLSCYDVRAR
jgi:outer membrane protein assembly factor BamB